MTNNSNKRIILITGNTETLGYFSRELAFYLHRSDREVFIWDMTRPVESISAFEALPDKDRSVLLTFNFIGCNGEGQFGNGLDTIWEQYGIEIVSIMVDSPVYYYRQLSAGIRGLSVACIDRNHVDYVKKWHPYIHNVYFWPLCGNEPVDDIWMKPGVMGHPPYIRPRAIIPHDQRYIDIVFIANYVTREGIESSIADADPEYVDFLHGICDDMIAHPGKELEKTLYESLLREFPDEETDAYPEAMFHMIYVDLYVRSYFRAQAVRTLTEAGYMVHCVGQDWDRLETLRPGNLIHTSVMMTSADCVRALETARISLNVMPGFKAGAHDRVFSSMLAGCATLTDTSSYLDEAIAPWEDYAPFIPGEPDSIIDAVSRLISEPELAQRIADTSRLKAERHFTWKKAADIINEVI